MMGVPEHKGEPAGFSGNRQVANRGSNGESCAKIVLRQRFGCDPGVFKDDVTACLKPDVVPYPYIPPAYGRQPVPSDAGQERWAVQAKNTSVAIFPAENLVLYGAGMIHLMNKNGDTVVASDGSGVSDVKARANEG